MDWLFSLCKGFVLYIYHLLLIYATGWSDGSGSYPTIFFDEFLHVLLNLQQPHGVVLRALANHSIPLMISGEEANISEAMLASVQPFHQVRV